MATKILQTVDFTILAMQKMHSACEMMSQSAQKGTFARMWDAAPAMCAFLCVLVVVAMFLGTCLVWLAYNERKIANQRNAYIPAPVTTIMGSATVNMKGCK